MGGVGWEGGGCLKYVLLRNLSAGESNSVVCGCTRTKTAAKSVSGSWEGGRLKYICQHFHYYSFRPYYYNKHGCSCYLVLPRWSNLGAVRCKCRCRCWCLA